MYRFIAAALVLVFPSLAQVSNPSPNFTDCLANPSGKMRARVASDPRVRSLLERAHAAALELPPRERAPVLASIVKTAADTKPGADLSWIGYRPETSRTEQTGEIPDTAKS